MSEDTHPNAGRASGYTDGKGNDVGEDVVNRVTELMIGPQTKLVLLADQLKELGAQQNAIVKTQDQRFEYLLTQLDAHLKKEDARHDALRHSEETTQQALTSAARMLDEITSYVQQSVTLSREANDRARRSEGIATESLTVVKSAIVRLGKVEKSVAALKKGQTASKKQAEIVLQLLQESREDRADLRHRIDDIAAVVEEHNRVSAEHAALMVDVAEMKERLEKLEARGG